MANTPEWPIEIKIGCDYSLQVDFVVSKTDLTPVPITGNTYTALLVDSAGATLATFVCVVTNGPLGILTVTLANTVTAALSPTSKCDLAWWDLIEDDSGVITDIFAPSEVTIKAAVSV